MIMVMRNLIKAFKALSDETRLRILNILLAQECCVCEVMQALDISQTRASRNLALLYDAGFLKLRKEGLWSFYSINDKNLEDYQIDMVRAIKKSLERNPLTILDRERLQRAERIGPGCTTKT